MQIHLNDVSLSAIKAIVFSAPAFWVADLSTVFVIDLLMPTVAESIKLYIGTAMGASISFVILLWWINKLKLSNIELKNKLMEQRKIESDLQAKVIKIEEHGRE